MNEHKPSAKEDKHYDWAKNAEDAARKAESEVDKLKKEAQQELHHGKDNFNNADDK